MKWDKKFGLVKVSPLAAWTKKDVWKRITSEQVPYNPLHDENYPSIGCQPCTRAVSPARTNVPGDGAARRRPNADCIPGKTRAKSEYNWNTNSREFTLMSHFPQIWLLISWNFRPHAAERRHLKMDKPAASRDTDRCRRSAARTVNPYASRTRRQCPVRASAETELELTKKAIDVSRAVQNLRQWPSS